VKDEAPSQIAADAAFTSTVRPRNAMAYLRNIALPCALVLLACLAGLLVSDHLAYSVPSWPVEPGSETALLVAGVVLVSADALVVGRTQSRLVVKIAVVAISAVVFLAVAGFVQLSLACANGNCL
jgi:hypothetical protein